MNRQTAGRSALTGVLNTITAATGAVAKVFTTVEDTITIGQTYVSAAAEKQQERIDLDLVTYAEDLLEETSMERTKRHVAIQAFYAEKPDNQALFEKNYLEIQRLLHNRRNPGSPMPQLKAA